MECHGVDCHGVTISIDFWLVQSRRVHDILNNVLNMFLSHLQYVRFYGANFQVYFWNNPCFGGDT